MTDLLEHAIGATVALSLYNILLAILAGLLYATGALDAFFWAGLYAFAATGFSIAFGFLTYLEDS